MGDTLERWVGLCGRLLPGQARQLNPGKLQCRPPWLVCAGLVWAGTASPYREHTTTLAAQHSAGLARVVLTWNMVNHQHCLPIRH